MSQQYNASSPQPRSTRPAGRFSRVLLLLVMLPLGFASACTSSSGDASPSAAAPLSAAADDDSAEPPAADGDTTEPDAKKKGASSRPERTIADVTVSGHFGRAPTLTYPRPWRTSKPQTKVLVHGTGARLHKGQVVLLAMYAENAKKGKVIRDDFAEVPVSYHLRLRRLGSDVYRVVRGKRVGSRILHTTVSDGVPVVMTIDILPIKATGARVKHVPTRTHDDVPVPRVSKGKGGRPVVRVDTKADPPSSLTTVPLRRGTGAQITAGSRAVLQFVAVRWSNGAVVDSTWRGKHKPATVTVSTDDLIEGLVDTLAEVAVGSRLMVIAPPAMAFGPAGGKLKKETLVYVVDVLAVEGS